MNKYKLLALIAAVLVFAIALCACGGDGNTGATEAPQQTEAGDSTPTLTTDTVLYYNFDRALYEAMAEDSLTGRGKNLTDGYFHIDMAVKGEVSEFLAKSRILTNTIDTNSAMFLTFKEGNIIDKALSIAEIGGSIACESCYVTTIEGNVVTMNTNNTNSGDVFTLTLADGVNIFDISDKESEDFGKTTTIEEMDELYAVADASGNVTHIWVLSRAGQNLGRGGCICGVGTEGTHKPGCDGTILYYWKPWTSKTTMPSSGGYWYLDVEGGVITLDSREWYKSNTDIYLDLNGHTVYGPDSGSASVFWCSDQSLKFNLTILDSAGGGKFVLRHQEGATGIQSRFLACIGPKHTVTIYGGTIDASNVGSDTQGGNGGLMRILNGATLNVHGGTMIASKQPTNTAALVFCSGVFNMTGGTLTGGSAIKGGNVFIGTYDSNGETHYGEFHMSGGEIINGTASKCGGNIAYYEDGVWDVTGGTISGGTSPDSPDIYMYPKFDPAA